MSRPIIVYDKKGREVMMPSISKAAKAMGISDKQIYDRLKDGNWIHREGFVPVRVREGV